MTSKVSLLVFIDTLATLSACTPTDTLCIVNKVIRTAKDAKASAKDLSSFADWLFTNGFINQDVHESLAKQCNGGGKAPKKKASEPVLSASTSQPTQMTVMPNGLVRPPSNPQLRAERAGKTLSKLSSFRSYKTNEV